MNSLFRKLLCVVLGVLPGLFLVQCRDGEGVSEPPEVDTVLVQDSTSDTDSISDTVLVQDSTSDTGRVDTLVPPPSGKDTSSAGQDPEPDSTHIIDAQPWGTRKIVQEYRVFLVGRVSDQNGKAISRASVELLGQGLADTTDESGTFGIQLAHPSLKRSGDRPLSEESWSDRLVIRRDGREVASLGVGRRWDSLPDIRVTRRLISGTLAPSPGRIGRLVASVRIQGDTLAYAFIMAQAGEGGAYSAEALFADSAAGKPFTIRMAAYGTEGNLTGFGDSAHFEANVAEPVVPAFDPLNALPKAQASGPERIRASDSLHLSGLATAGRGGPIMSTEWDVGNTGTFIAASADGRLSRTAPSLPVPRFECVFRARDSSGNVASDTLAVEVEADPFQGYRAFWGDVHSHSSFSRDFRTPDSAFAEACRQDPACRDLAGPAYLFRNAILARLDFAMVTDHAEDMTVEEWKRTGEIVREFDRPGAFVPFMGYEYCDSTGGLESCVNIVFPGTQGGKVYAAQSLSNGDSGMAAESLAGEALLWSRLAAEEPAALAFLPHPAEGVPADFGSEKRRFLIGAEVSSTGGSPSEEENRLCYIAYLDALRLGNRLQALGAGNDHEGRPGRASLTAVLSKDLTRESIVEALRRRRTYATRGERMDLRFDVEGHIMGEEFEARAGADGEKRIRIRASVTVPGGSVQRLVVKRIRNGEDQTLAVFFGEGQSLDAELEEVLEAGESALYWAEANVAAQNPDFGSEGWTSPVWVRVLPP